MIVQADIEAIEEAGDVLLRLRRTQTAIKMYALALRLRRDLGLLPVATVKDGVARWTDAAGIPHSGPFLEGENRES